MSISGKNAMELVNWIQRKYDIQILPSTPDDQSTPIESTTYWNDMQRNRAGNLLAGARLKAELSQKELADKVGIRQNMVSEYEHGRRRITREMAQRVGKVLGVNLAAMIET
ncbi:MAG: hypothetical protein A2X46_05535 [Lentisphaerae bacterium GWF2_57_35]|nr:MAG: hypothetical protein A2X46_05535 [Lentisphaerae bacterium GWF2_57_35]